MASGLLALLVATGCDEASAPGSEKNDGSSASDQTSSTGETEDQEPSSTGSTSTPSPTDDASTDDASTDDASESSSTSTSDPDLSSGSQEIPKDLELRAYEEDLANRGYESALMLYPEFEDQRSMPVVVVIHGWRGSKEKMRWIGERVAKTGFAVLVVTASNAKDLFAQPKDWIKNYSAALDSLQAENERSQSPLHQRLDLTKISLVGHSMGGGGALFFAQEHPKQLTSIVALAPYSRDANKEVANIDAPTLILTGGKDSVAPPKMGDSFFEALDETLVKEYQELEDVGHNDFEKDGAHHDRIAAQVLDWLDQHGRGQ